MTEWRCCRITGNKLFGVGTVVGWFACHRQCSEEGCGLLGSQRLCNDACALGGWISILCRIQEAKWTARASQRARGRSATHMSIDLQKAAERSARAAIRRCDRAMEGNLAWWESITNSANHDNFIDPILKSHLGAAERLAQIQAQIPRVKFDLLCMRAETSIRVVGFCGPSVSD